MSVVQCSSCDKFIDTDFEDYDFKENKCEVCIFMEGITVNCNNDNKPTQYINQKARHSPEQWDILEQEKGEATTQNLTKNQNMNKNRN